MWRRPLVFAPRRWPEGTELGHSGDDAWGIASKQHRGGEKELGGDKEWMCHATRYALPEAGVLRSGSVWPSASGEE
jgi:hypothetical protein